MSVQYIIRKSATVDAATLNFPWLQTQSKSAHNRLRCRSVRKVFPYCGKTLCLQKDLCASRTNISSDAAITFSAELRQRQPG